MEGAYAIFIASRFRTKAVFEARHLLHLDLTAARATVLILFSQIVRGLGKISPMHATSRSQGTYERKSNHTKVHF